MTTPEDRVGVIRTESERIQQYLGGLSPDGWNTPSACEGWLAGDVVAHLSMAVDMYKGNITRGVQGDSTPSQGMPAPGGGDQAARMAANAQRAVDLRISLGDQLLPTFTAQCEALNQLLAGLGPDDWDKPCFHPAATVSVGAYLNMRITELIVHEWDIRSRLESTAPLSVNALPAVMDVIPMIVGRFFQPGTQLDKPARFRFEVTGVVSGSHDIIAGGGKAQMEPAGSVPADVTFRCDTDTFILINYGRITVEKAMAEGRLTVEGDRELALKFDS